MNNITLHGRLTRDPERVVSQSGKEIVKFTVAVNRRFAQENGPKADFFDCVAFGGTGSTIAGYMQKGREILIKGSMQSNHWETSDGQKRISWNVAVDEFDFCGSKNDNQSQPSQMAQTSQAPRQAETTSAVNDENFDGIITEDELPF